MLLRNVFGKTLRDLRWPTFWAALALGSIAGYFTLLYPTYSSVFNLQQILDQLPPAMKAVIGAQFVDISSATGFLNIQLFPIFLPAILGGYAIALGSGLTAAEESRGTIDVLLSYPIARWRLVTEKSLAVVISVALVAAGLWVGATAGAAASASELASDHVAAGLVHAWALALAFGALALLIAAWRGNRSAAVGVSVAVLAVMYFINALAPIIGAFDTIKGASLFFWYIRGDPLKNGLAAADVALLLVVASVLFVLSLIAFERRNLSA